MSRDPTPKQNAARARNWRIRNLRSLYAQSHILTGSRRTAVLAIIDDELEAAGAERTALRNQRILQEQ